MTENKQSNDQTLIINYTKTIQARLDRRIRMEQETQDRYDRNSYARDVAFTLWTAKTTYTPQQLKAIQCVCQNIVDDGMQTLRDYGLVQ